MANAGSFLLVAIPILALMSELFLNGDGIFWFWLLILAFAVFFAARRPASWNRHVALPRNAPG
jgi:hypothetical protein